MNYKMVCEEGRYRTAGELYVALFELMTWLIVALVAIAPLGLWKLYDLFLLVAQ